MLSHATVNNAKIAPFKYQKGNDYGAFINTTTAGSFPVAQNIQIGSRTHNFNWPSSEHAFHAQKIIHRMQALEKSSAPNPLDPATQTIFEKALRTLETTKNKPGQEFHPRTDFSNYVDNLCLNEPNIFGRNKKEFDELCGANYHARFNPNAGINPGTGEPYTTEFMRHVLELKFEQYPELAQKAMDMAEQGIMPIEYSSKDSNWASGAKGDGANRLGILILEAGIDLLKAKGKQPHADFRAPNSPASAYKKIQQQNPSAFAHDNLNSVSKLPSQNRTNIQNASGTANFPKNPPASRSSQKPTHQQVSKTQIIATKESAKTISKNISSFISKDQKALSEDLPLVAKGDLEGTLKVAFNDMACAQALMDKLQDQGYNVTCHGLDGTEMYPMDGRSFIVRFEEPAKDAKAFVEKTLGLDADNYSKVMSLTSTELGHKIENVSTSSLSPS